MPELLLVRHGQASFGKDNYDELSDLGFSQANIVGAWLKERGWQPDRILTGTLVRQKETWTGMGLSGTAVTHPGFNEYNHTDLLHVYFNGDIPVEVRTDRRQHFRALRKVVRLWQNDELSGVDETWGSFTSRVEAARQAACQSGAERVLVVTSGGTIGRIVTATLQTPNDKFMDLNLQVKNTSLTRFIFTEHAFYLHEFNTTPHLDSRENAGYITYA